MKPCKGCGKSVTSSSMYPTRPTATYAQRTATPPAATATDDDFVLVLYDSPNISQQIIFGTVQFEYMLTVPPGMRIQMVPHPAGGWRFMYGYRAGGETFMVHKADAERERFYRPVEPVRAIKAIPMPSKKEKRDLPPPPTPPKRMTIEDVIGMPEDSIDERKQLQEKLDDVPEMAYDVLSDMVMEEVRGENRPWVVEMIKGKIDAQMAPEMAPEAIPDPDAPPTLPPPPPPPPSLDEIAQVPYSSGNKVNLQSLPGIGKSLAEALHNDGYETMDDILSLGIEGLREYDGIGETKAERIIKAATAFINR